MDGGLYLSASAHGHRGFVLWKSDGTGEGTVVLEDPGTLPQRVTNVNGRLYFAADDLQHGLELLDQRWYQMAPTRSEPTGRKIRTQCP